MRVFMVQLTVSVQLSVVSCGLWLLAVCEQRTTGDGLLTSLRQIKHVFEVLFVVEPAGGVVQGDRDPDHLGLGGVGQVGAPGTDVLCPWRDGTGGGVIPAAWQRERYRSGGIRKVLKERPLERV